MTDWALNLSGNMESKSLSTAEGVATLTSALKAEEKVLNSARVAAQRAAVGSDPKKYARAAAAVKEATGRVSLLRAESARLANEDRIAKFYKGSSGAALVSNSLVKKTSSAWKDLGESIKSGGGVALSAVSTGAKVAAVGMGVATVAAVGLAVKLYEVGKAALSAGVSLADEARSARLLNEAADLAGGTHLQLSGIITDVNRRATIGVDRISAMGRELRIMRFDSRQTQLTLSAMATAESALGQGASGAVKGIAESSRAMRRFSLGIRDSYGEYEALKRTGLTKGEVFSELARIMGRSSADVQREVAGGRVSITKGMQAIDAALSRKFGGNVAKQALGIDRTFSKLREDFVQLFAGANIEPVLKGLSSVASLFSRDTAEGKAFGEVVSRVMNQVGKTIENLTPDIKEFLVSLGSEAAQPGGLADAIRGWISDAKALGGTLKDVASAIKDIAAAAKTVSGAVSSVTGAFTTKAETPELERVNKQLSIDAQLRQQGKKDGEALTAGVVEGVNAGSAQSVSAVTNMANAMSKAFRDANLIKSPSRRYERDSVNIPAGSARGIDKGTPVAVAAVVDMSNAMSEAYNLKPQQAGTSVRHGDRTVHQMVHIHGIPGAESIGPELARWTKFAVDQGPSLGAG